MATWDDVSRIALGLPETSEDESRGTRAWRVRDKGFVWERPLRKSDLKALGDAAPDGPILGARVALLGWTAVAAVLLAGALAALVALLVPILRAWSTPTVGVSFVLAVAPESLAVLAASLHGAAWLRGVAIALFVAGLAALHSVVPTPGLGGEGPLVQAHATLAQRVVEALVGPGDEAVERYRDLRFDWAHARWTSCRGRNHRRG